MASFLAQAAADALAAQQAADAAASREGLVAAARARLVEVLGAGANAGALTEADVQVEDHLVVLTDGAVYLAVTPAGASDAGVWLVRDDDGWTALAQLTSMADLGTALAARTGKG